MLNNVGIIRGNYDYINHQTLPSFPLVFVLTFETEANGDSRSTNERSPSLVGSLGSSCQYKRFLSCLGCSSRPSVKYFGPHGALFKFLCPHRPAGQAGSRSGSPVFQYVSVVWQYKFGRSTATKTWRSRTSPCRRWRWPSTSGRTWRRRSASSTPGSRSSESSGKPVVR